MIPKKIFQTWKTQKLPEKILKLQKKMLTSNENYEHIIYTDDQMHDYISSNAPNEIKKLYFRINNIVAKADVWRYFILFNQGGIYLDIDSQINCKLDNFINFKDEGLATAEKNENLFVQWALIYNKNHPVLEKTLNYILEATNKNLYLRDHHSLTVKTYAKAIFDFSFSAGLELKWHELNKKTNIELISNDSKLRIVGVDYNNAFIFKHKFNHLLRNLNNNLDDKEHWTNKQITENVYD